MSELTLKEEIPAILKDINNFNQELNLKEIIAPKELKEHINLRDTAFYKLEELSYDHDYPRREAFENVLGVMDNPAFNFVYLISGKAEGIDIYLGVVKNLAKDYNRLHAFDYGNDLLNSALKGNFQGTKTRELKRDEIQEGIIKPLSELKRSSLITGIPSLNQNNEEFDFQGIDRLINSMAGETWQLMIVCQPVEKKEVIKVKEKIYQLYNDLYKKAELSLQRGKSETETESRAEGENSNRSKSLGTSESKGGGTSKNRQSGKTSKGKSTSFNKGTTKNVSVSKGESKTTTRGKNETTSESATINLVNKEIQELLKYIDEELLERVKLGGTKGLYKTSIYALAKTKTVQQRLERSIMSIFQGDSSSFSPLEGFELSANLEREESKKLLANFQNYKTKLQVDDALPLLFGYPTSQSLMELSTYMTSRELSLIAGFPIKEVAGLKLNEGVDFALNIPQKKEDKGISLGSILQRGRKLKDNKLKISQDALNKHIFVAGVTGSGKTTTCQRLLAKSKLPFLVIEPAKTEYRELYKSGLVEDLEIYTLGNEKLAPFRLNPFELLKGESLTAHIDILKASFAAAFPMEAAMPQILEMAIYKIYEDYGWDIDTDENIYSEDPWSANGRYWPALDDLVEALKVVVKEQGFGRELEQNYVGALISRISNLTIGAKGRMINCKESIDFIELLDKKVVFELDNLKSSQDKALLMALVLARLSEALRIKHREDNDFKHLTLIEEAHRLLSNVHPSEGGSKKHAVEMFSDMLAEVRKYGEGLIIVDQIPNKLAPDVIKNTNTKIIHKLFAQDDKDVVGDTMAMEDKQKDYLSRMKPGEAVVFSQSWHQPVNLQVKDISDTNSKDIAESEIRNLGLEQIFKEQERYFPELARADIRLSKEELDFYQRYRIRLLKKGRKFIKSLKADINYESKEVKFLLDEIDNFKKEGNLSEAKLEEALSNDILLSLDNSFADKVEDLVRELVGKVIKEEALASLLKENAKFINKLKKYNL